MLNRCLHRDLKFSAESKRFAKALGQAVCWDLECNAAVET